METGPYVETVTAEKNNSILPKISMLTNIFTVSGGGFPNRHAISNADMPPRSEPRETTRAILSRATPPSGSFRKTTNPAIPVPPTGASGSFRKIKNPANRNLSGPSGSFGRIDFIPTNPARTLIVI
jgi:hypothetical protein